MSSWDEFCVQRHRAIERFVNGDADPYRQLWCHADDVTIFGGWGAYEQGWDVVSRRLDWAASGSARGAPTSTTSRSARAVPGLLDRHRKERRPGRRHGAPGDRAQGDAHLPTRRRRRVASRASPRWPSQAR